jgi:hypothetical protein
MRVQGYLEADVKDVRVRFNMHIHGEILRGHHSFANLQALHPSAPSEVSGGLKAYLHCEVET